MIHLDKLVRFRSDIAQKEKRIDLKVRGRKKSGQKNNIFLTAIILNAC